MAAVFLGLYELIFCATKGRVVDKVFTEDVKKMTWAPDLAKVGRGRGRRGVDCCVLTYISMHMFVCGCICVWWRVLSFYWEEW